jgi:flagellar biosynthetic protein FliQ
LDFDRDHAAQQFWSRRIVAAQGNWFADVHVSDSGYSVSDSTLARTAKMMTPDDAVMLAQQALIMSLLLSAPLLVVGMIVGLLIGLAQALTQVQDQTVAFVPKLVAMVICLLLCLPWLVQKLMEYSETLIAGIPRMMMGG